MKPLLLLISIAFISCNEQAQPKVKDTTLIYSSYYTRVSKIRVDSVDYLIATSSNGISIIKHGNIKN